MQNWNQACGADPNQVQSIGALLAYFVAVSRLKVNMTKSVLVPVGIADNAGEFASILGCGTTSLPLKYLGLHLR